MSGVTALSSWTCDNLQACFTIGTNEEPSIMDDIVQQDKCICLTCTGDILDNPCTLDITADSGIAFRTIHIVSQCRLLELFGNHGEYLSTFPGELFDEYEDTSIYVTKIKLKRSLTNLSVKFTRLKEKEFWIYGIYLTKINLSSHSSRGSQQTNPPLAMNNLLSSQPPSLMHFQNLLQNSSDQTNLPNLLSTFLQGMGGAPVSINNSNEVSSTLGSIGGTNSQAPNQQTPTTLLTLQDIERVMNTELRKMESRLLIHMDEKFDQLQNKLDFIVDKLQVLQQNTQIETENKLELPPRISDLKIEESDSPPGKMNGESLQTDNQLTDQ